MKSASKKIHHPTTTARFRQSLLASACVLMLGGAGTTNALAQSGSYDLPYVSAGASMLALTNYMQWVTTSQFNQGAGPATPTGTSIGVIHNGPGGATPVTVTGSFTKAISAGNQATSSIDLALVANTGAADGAAILASQVQAATATASVAGAFVHVTESGMPSAAMVVGGTTLSAAVQLNQSDSSLSGVIANGYVSAATGSTATGHTPSNLTSATTGSLNIGTHQTALDAGAYAGSAASVDSGIVALDLNTTAGNVIGDSLSVSDNAISARFGANASSNIIAAAAGSAAFQGSAVITNTQANVETAAAVPLAKTASLTNSQVLVNYRNGIAGNQTTLTGPLVASGNSMEASSTGNSAGARNAAGAILAGNAILLDNGAAVTGTGSATSNSLVAGSNTLVASLGADLIVLNGQGNQGTALVSDIAASKISVKGDGLSATGSIDLSGNSLAAASTGNLAGNLILAKSSNLTATATAGNVQSNDATPITATATGATITAGVGAVGIPQGGAITANANTIGATAEGSAATTTISLDATNLASRLAANAPSSASAAPVSYGTVTSTAGVSASNLQGNYGAGTSIAATITGASVAVDLVDQAPLATGTRVPGLGIDISVGGNAIRAAATGNSASTQAALSGTNGNAQAAVGNTQVNGNLITSLVTDSGVRATAGGLAGSALTVSDNTISASAAANQADNSVSAKFTSFVAGPSAPGSTVTDALASSSAALAIANGQHNEAAVSATNLTATSFAVVDAGIPGALGAGVAGSTLSATGNSATASTTGNKAANSLTLDVANLSAAAPVVGLPSNQIGGITNLQVDSAASASAEVGRSVAGGGLLVGVQFNRSLTDSSVTASANEVASSATGNTASNTMAVTGTNLNSAPGAAATTVISSVTAGSGSIQNEFAVLSRQVDSAATRNALTRNALVGIDDDVVVPAGNTMSASSLTVDGNRVAAEARNNNAVNTINLSGFSSLNSGAGVLNEQSSGAAVQAEVQNARVRIRARSTDIDGANMALTDNSVGALAVGSSATNGVTVQATNLSGNASIPATAGGSSYVPGAGLTTNADFGVANVQTQTGLVQASADASVRVLLTGSNAVDSSATISGNSVSAIAQATSASNSLSLNATGVSGVTGAVASVQSTFGSVTAGQTTPAGQLAFAVTVPTVAGTAIVVSNNSILSAAGQNEAFNRQDVTGTNITGGAAGNNLSAAVAGGIASTGADFSVLNVQSGGFGAVTATAQPLTIGAQVDAADGGSLSVTGNSATAKVNLNNAGNTLNLVAAGQLAATGAVNNVQTTTGGFGMASVDAAGTTVGISPVINGTVLNATPATVSGNSLTAQAGGNTASNALNAISGGSLAGSATNPTFAVLNSQSNGAVMLASVNFATLGINANGGTGGSLTNTAATVLSNQVLAYGYGNTASNSLVLGQSQGTLYQASASIRNVQSNTASITSTVTGITIGIQGGAASGGASVVNGNGVTAQVVGNRVVNTIGGN